MKIISEETGLPMTAITKKGNNSYLVVEETKQTPTQTLGPGGESHE